jgi:hypothetical protein
LRVFVFADIFTFRLKTNKAMISFNLYYLVFGIAGFVIAVYTTRWIFKIDEMNDNIKEQTVIFKKILGDKEFKENN